MSFVLPLRPSRTARSIRPQNPLQPPQSPRRRPSLATRGGIAKRRKSSVNSFNAPSLSFFEGMFGEEFPEAFSNGDGRAGKSRASILDLPIELMQNVCASLSKSDLKRLRCTNGKLAEKVELRIDRVFISPNRANLGSLTGVLIHPRYRLQVEEIVWDDSQLEEFPTLESFDHAISSQEAAARREIQQRLEDSLFDGNDNDNEGGSEDPEFQTLDRDDLFLRSGQLTDAAKTLVLRLDNQASRDIIAKNATMMSVEESYTLYQKLYQDEQEIMKRGLDVTALHRALAELPNLKRITLTSEVWRSWKLVPPYDTAFFRALPPGFRKPSVWPWLGTRPDASPAWVAHRDQTMTQPVDKRLPFEWRAYSIIIAALVAVPHPGIEAFTVDTGNEDAGISHQLFAEPNKEYDMTTQAFQAIPLKMFKLAINSYGASKTEGQSCQYLDSGLLKNLFSAMVHLEHLDFNPNTLACGTPRNSVFLHPENVFSDSTLCKLKHFALRNILMTGYELYELITTMESAESITLNNVRFDLSYYELLHRLRDHFYAAETCRPRFSIIQACNRIESRTIAESYLLNEEIDEFLYNRGECPVSEELVRYPKSGFGWVVNDRDPTQCERFVAENVRGTEQDAPMR